MRRFFLMLICVFGLLSLTARAAETDADMESKRATCKEGVVQVIINLGNQVRDGKMTLEGAVDHIRKVSAGYHYNPEPMVALIRALFDKNLSREQIDKLLEAEIVNCATFKPKADAITL